MPGIREDIIFNRLTWFISEQCNFNCEYCFQKNNKKTDIVKPIDVSVLSKSLDALDGKWLISITGGEPFLEKNIIEVCQKITEKQYLGILTNLSTPNVYDFADKISPERCLYLSASIHINEREKSDKNLKKFIEKVKYFQDKGFLIRPLYIAHPPLFDRLHKDIEMLENNGVENVEVKAFFGDYNNKMYPKSYTLEERQLLRKLLKIYQYELEEHYYFGRICYAGTHIFVADRNGNMTRCHSTLRSYGNLFQGTFKIDKKPRPCPMKYCDCTYFGYHYTLPEKAPWLEIIKEGIADRSYYLKKYY